MQLTPDQKRILDDIQATRQIADHEANWAVAAGLAAQAEDGDIDLTQEGRRYVDSTRL